MLWLKQPRQPGLEAINKVVMDATLELACRKERMIRDYLWKERTHRLNVCVIYGSEPCLFRVNDTTYRLQQHVGIRRYQPQGWVAPLP